MRHAERDEYRRQAIGTASWRTKRPTDSRDQRPQGAPLADLIRGKLADDALDILKYQPHRGARMLEKVLHSAMANAEDRRRRTSTA